MNVPAHFVCVETTLTPVYRRYCCAAVRCCVLISTAFCSIRYPKPSCYGILNSWYSGYSQTNAGQCLQISYWHLLQTRCKFSAATHSHCVGLFRFSQTRLCLAILQPLLVWRNCHFPDLYWWSRRSSVQKLPWPKFNLIIRVCFGWMRSLTPST